MRKVKKPTCCQPPKKPTNLLNGIFYGILPHGFCIAFIIFSILGVTAATSFLKNWLMNAYFFPLLILLSIALVTVSAVIYLKRNQALSWQGIAENRRYLFLLYSTVIATNLILFLVVFPLTANLKFSPDWKNSILAQEVESKTIKVAIPCSGHAPLVIDELKKVKGIVDVQFQLPNLFNITYQPKETSIEKILETDIFKSFKAEII